MIRYVRNFQITMHIIVPFAAVAMAASATTSWPCPKETLWKFLWAPVYPNFFPKASTSFRGFTPGDKMKKIGVEGPTIQSKIIAHN